MEYEQFKRDYFRSLPWGTVSRLLRSVGLNPDILARDNPSWDDLSSEDWAESQGMGLTRTTVLQPALLAIRAIDLLQRNQEFQDVDPCGIFAYAFETFRAYLAAPDDFTSGDLLFLWRGSETIDRNVGRIRPTYMLYNRTKKIYCVENDQEPAGANMPALVTALTLDRMVPQRRNEPWRLG